MVESTSLCAAAKADMFIITSAFISVNIIVLIIINKEDLRHRFGCSVSRVSTYY